jgi:hypothetical protein
VKLAAASAAEEGGKGEGAGLESQLDRLESIHSEVSKAA